ncbi:hypothetical protein [Micromonospora coxensis]|uniref:Uncharacterized protein n=1 Tax=Micromonospora coxensis TaxID=356852 RepID=A0A1C5K0X5_9ACTN|nr:hypothetical protein [Micromonospora coxensis]SCG76460.1 hypothetical protein GA0070614_5925 [Micromonospora coxensis]
MEAEILAHNPDVVPRLEIDSDSDAVHRGWVVGQNARELRVGRTTVVGCDASTRRPPGPRTLNHPGVKMS